MFFSFGVSLSLIASMLACIQLRLNHINENIWQQKFTWNQFEISQQFHRILIKYLFIQLFRFACALKLLFCSYIYIFLNFKRYNRKASSNCMYFCFIKFGNCMNIVKWTICIVRAYNEAREASQHFLICLSDDCIPTVVSWLFDGQYKGGNWVYTDEKLLFNDSICNYRWNPINYVNN